MRILQLVQKPQRRGAEMFAHQLAGALRQQGHTVKVAYLYAHEGEGVIPLHPDDVALDRRETHLSERVPGVNLRLLRDLLSTIDAFRPDIVQLNGSRTVKYGALARQLRRGAPWRAVYRNIGNPGDWTPSAVKRLALRMMMSRVDGSVALTESALGSLRSLYPVRAPAVVIPNGIDVTSLAESQTRASTRATLATPADAPVVLSVGSLSREKRVDLLLHAFLRVRQRQPEAVLWVVGDGSKRAKLEALVTDLGLALAVRFTGVRSDIGALMSAADVFALTSDTEGIPAVILEAGYQRLPVVATRVGGIPDTVRDGETGLLVPPGDAEAIGGALLALVRDPARRAAMGVAAREAVLSRYTMEVVARQYAEFYASLAAGQPSRRLVTPQSAA